MKLKSYLLITVLFPAFNTSRKQAWMLRLLVALIITSAIQGCDHDKPGVYKNDKISAGKHDLFSKMNSRLLAALKSNNTHDVEAMMSQGLLDQDNSSRTIQLINLNSQSGGYTVLDEYYIHNDTPRLVKPIRATATDGTKYTLFYPYSNTETYIAFIMPKAKDNKYMITVVYNKYDYGWRLSMLDFQPYIINGKTAPQLALAALDKFNNGYLIDAYLDMRLADNCMRPSNLWMYPQQKGFRQFDHKIINIIGSYTYPLVISEVPTKPKIFEVSYQTTTEGVFPVIRYVSSVNMKNRAAQDKENDEIKKTIGQMFLGIDKDKKYIYFSAYNELPKPHKNPVTYDWEDKL